MEEQEIKKSFIDEKTKPSLGGDQYDQYFLDDYLLGEPTTKVPKEKPKKILKAASSIQLQRFKSNKKDGVELRKQTYAVLLDDEANKIMVDEFGNIALI